MNKYIGYNGAHHSSQRDTADFEAHVKYCCTHVVSLTRANTTLLQIFFSPHILHVLVRIKI